MTNLRTARYDNLDLAQRAEACQLAYEDGREAMENDLAGDGVTIAEYVTLAEDAGVEGVWLNLIELLWTTDQCPEEDWEYWSHEGSAGDPRYAAFRKGWREREAELREDAIEDLDVFDATPNVLVTAENVDDLRQGTSAVDQRDSIKVGETVSLYAFRYQPGGQRGDALVMHDSGLAGICFGADSEWGDWDEGSRTIFVSSGVYRV